MSVDVLYVYLCFICKKSKILFTPLQASPLRCGHVSGKMIKVRTESHRGCWKAQGCCLRSAHSVLKATPSTYKDYLILMAVLHSPEQMGKLRQKGCK